MTLIDINIPDSFIWALVLFILGQIASTVVAMAKLYSKVNAIQKELESNKNADKSDRHDLEIKIAEIKDVKKSIFTDIKRISKECQDGDKYSVKSINEVNEKLARLETKFEMLNKK